MAKKQYVLMLTESGNDESAMLRVGTLTSLKRIADGYRVTGEFYWADASWQMFQDMYGRAAYYRRATEWEGVTEEDVFEADFFTYTIYEIKDYA